MSDPIETLNRLFDTLRDASNRNEKSTDKLIDQQIKLIGEIKNMPITDIKTALKDHADQTAVDKKEIDTHTNEIMEMLRIILGKVNKMMTVFALVVAITMGTYVVIRYLAEDKNSVEELRQELKEERQAEQKEFLEMIKKEMEKLHENDQPKYPTIPHHTHEEDIP